jgi:predicted nucleic acid-binding protein
MDEAYVVDSSVFVRWFIDQVGYEHAREVRDAFLTGAVELVAPDLARVELANGLRKAGLLREHLNKDEYVAAVRTLDDLGVELVAQDADGSSVSPGRRPTT